MGLYAQSACILLGAPGAIEDVDAALAPLAGTRTVMKGDRKHDPWVGGDSVMIEEGPIGITIVDLIERVWPDDMGDPESEPTLFSAWATGMFGPSVFPGSLERAASINRFWREGSREIHHHVAFLRIRLLGSPSRANAHRDLAWIATVADALLKLPAALCFFDPNGEVLLSRLLFESRLRAWDRQQSLPLDLWTTIRFLSDPSHPSWAIIDIVGLRRFGLPDHEVVARKDRFALDDLASFLAGVGACVMGIGDVPGNGAQLVGPDGIRFRATSDTHALNSPARPVIRWFAMNGDVPPADFAPSLAGSDGGLPARGVRYRFEA